jgi:RNA polymerase sigma-70 factor (ECF subfamily)
MASVASDSAETCRLLERVHAGDARALDELLKRQRPGLRDFVAVRLSPRIAARVDASDVVQETMIAVVGRMDDFLRRRPMPFRLWVRKTAYERLIDLHRHQTRARRSVDRERAWPDRSSLLVAGPLLAGGPSPSQQLAAREWAERISRAVARLGEADREVLLMRHGEGLPFEEIGCLLDIEPAAARKRFGRALIRLQKHLTDQGVME